MAKAGEQEADLTKNESRILYCLAKNRGKIVSRDVIINDLWDSELFVDDNTLTVNITRLRAKLESIGRKGVIHTKRGQGVSVRMNLREYIKERWLQFIMLLAVLTVVILFGVLVMIPNFYLLLVGVSFVSIWFAVWCTDYMRKRRFLQDSGKSSGTS